MIWLIALIIMNVTCTVLMYGFALSNLYKYNPTVLEKEKFLAYGACILLSLSSLLLGPLTFILNVYALDHYKNGLMFRIPKK